MPRSSPARSQGALVAPRRNKPRSSRSMGSPAGSTASGRLSNIVDKFMNDNKDSFAVSSLSKTFLSDNTEIEMPSRKSWWKKVENSRDVIEVLETNMPANSDNVLEEFDVEILSQEKKDFTLDLPESSGSESIGSIVVSQRKLFTQKENVPQKKFGQVVDNPDSLGQTSKRPKPVFPSTLLNISLDKTTNKTKEIATDIKTQPKTLFGNRPSTKRKNMFADFLVSENEEEIPEIQPKIFDFNKQSEQTRRSSTASRGLRDQSPPSKINLEQADSSDSESINSIVSLQRKLFNQKENVPQKKSGQVIDNQESLAKHSKTDFSDKTAYVGTKNLFSQNSKRPKPVFPSALLNISVDKSANKTKEMAVEVKVQPKTLFGNRPSTKRKNIFADFILSESEDDIPEIQPKIFAFNKRSGSTRRSSTTSRGQRDQSPTSSITTDIEMDDWKLLPSSTMVEHQLQADLNTPGKRARLSKLSEAKESTKNSTKQNSQLVSSKNKSKSLLSPAKNQSANNSTVEDKSKSSNDESKVSKKNASQNKSKINANNSKDKTLNDNIPEIVNEKTYDISSAQDKGQVINKTVTLVKHLSKSQNIDDVQENDQQCLNTANKINNTKDKTQIINKTVTTTKNLSKGSNIDNEQQENIFETANEISISKDNSRNSNKIVTVMKNLSKSLIIEGVFEDVVNCEMPQKESVAKPALYPIVESEKHEEIAPTDENNDIENVQENIDNAEIPHIDKNKATCIEDINEEHESMDDIEERLSRIVGQEDQVTQLKTQSLNKSAHLTSKIVEETPESKIDKLNLSSQFSVRETVEKENKAITENINENQDSNNEKKHMSLNKNKIESNNLQGMEGEKNVKETETTNEDAEIGEEKQEDSEQNQIDVSDRDEAEASLIVEASDQEDQTDADQDLEVDEEEEPQQYNQDNFEAGSHKLEEPDKENKEENVEEIDEEQEDDEIELTYDDELVEEEENAEEINDNVEEQDDEIRLNQDDEIVEDQENDYEIVENEEVEEQDVDETKLNHDDELVEEQENDDEIEDNEEVEEQENDDEIAEESSQEIDQDEQEDEQLLALGNEDQNESENEDNESSEKRDSNILHKELENQDVENDETEFNASVAGHGKEELIATIPQTNSFEACLHQIPNEMHSFFAKRKSTILRKTNTPPRQSTGLSDGTKNSSAERSGWDSHRTTRKTLRQTFGKDFTPRKSLRTLVMEKSAKRQTVINEANARLKLPLANSTEINENNNMEIDYDENVAPAESDHEASRQIRQTTLEMYLQKIKKENVERKQKIEQQVKNSLKSNPDRFDLLNFRVPNKPAIRKAKSTLESTPKVKRIKPSVIPLEDLPSELREDMKYKPPKRFRPRNASWITKRLYKFLETKLEPKYDYRARVRAEKLVETLYNFVRDTKRLKVAPSHSVAELKREMARLDIVTTHFDFHNFFSDYMPLEVKIKVVPDIINRIPIPRGGIFAPILE